MRQYNTNINFGIVGNIDNINKFIDKTFSIFRNLYLDESSTKCVDIPFDHGCNAYRKKSLYKIFEINKDIIELSSDDLDNFIKSNCLKFVIIIIDIEKLNDDNINKHIITIASDLVKDYDEYFKFIIMNDKINDNWLDTIINQFSKLISQKSEKHDFHEAMNRLITSHSRLIPHQTEKVYKLFCRDFYDYNNDEKNNDNEMKNLYKCLAIWNRSRQM